MYLKSLYGDGGETCVSSNPIPNGSVWGTTGEPHPVNKLARMGQLELGQGSRGLLHFKCTFLCQASAPDKRTPITTTG